MKQYKIMWLFMVLAACVLILQFHASNTWVAGPPQSSSDMVSDDLARTVAERVQAENSLAASVGQHVLRELTLQLARELVGIGACRDVLSLLAETTSPMMAATAAEKIEVKTTTARPVPSPRLYVITPTYRRPEQIPELTRLAQTLMHVDNLHWLVIEDAADKTQLVTELLRKTRISFDHLLAPMPDTYKTRRGPKPRGVSNRNRGLEWIRANATSGVFYFADDDNTYDIELFEEMRSTRKVSMWPVGLCTKFGLSTPVVSGDKFLGFYDGWVAGRKFPVDMAGFAVSIGFLLQRPNAKMPYKPGFEEDGFLKSLTPFEPSQIELKANKCSKILVWHTQTKKNDPSSPLNMTKYANTNLIQLKKLIV